MFKLNRDTLDLIKTFFLVTTVTLGISLPIALLIILQFCPK